MENENLWKFVKNKTKLFNDLDKWIKDFLIWEGTKNEFLSEKLIISFEGDKFKNPKIILKALITKYSYFLKHIRNNLVNVQYSNWFFVYTRIITEYFAIFHFIKYNEFSEWEDIAIINSLYRVNKNLRKEKIVPIKNMTDYLLKIDEQLANNYALSSVYIHGNINFEDIADPSGQQFSISFTSFLDSFFTTALMTSVLIKDIIQEWEI